MAGAVKKKKRTKRVVYRIGDKYTVEGVKCLVRFVNAGMAWLFPVKDNPEMQLNRCVSFAKAYEDGRIEKL